MHALAGRHHGRGRRAGRLGVELAQLVHPDTRCIDDAARPYLECASAFLVARMQPGQLPALVNQACHRAVVEQKRALERSGSGQRQRKPRIVKLAVPVFDAALKALRLCAR